MDTGNLLKEIKSVAKTVGVGLLALLGTGAVTAIGVLIIYLFPTISAVVLFVGGVVMASYLLGYIFLNE